MSPFKTTTDFKKFYTEVGEWCEKNFGPIVPTDSCVKYAHQPLLGIIEELGELEEAIRYYDKIAVMHNLNTVATDGRLLDSVVDAIGDVMIYKADYCRVLGINIEHVTERIYPKQLNEIPTFEIIGKLCHAQLKMEQGIRGDRIEHLKMLISLLQTIYSRLCTICWERNIDFDYCIEVTWNKVKNRDWNKNKINGGLD
jgi:NTP pyrophosphatase (non-canonical NTP hydrolase)